MSLIRKRGLSRYILLAILVVTATFLFWPTVEDSNEDIIIYRPNHALNPVGQEEVQDNVEGAIYDNSKKEILKDIFENKNKEKEIIENDIDDVEEVLVDQGRDVNDDSPPEEKEEQEQPVPIPDKVEDDVDTTNEPEDKVHVVFSFGRDYIVPAFVAVNSSLTNSKSPSRLVIHLLVEPMIASRVQSAFSLAFNSVARMGGMYNGVLTTANEVPSSKLQRRGVDGLKMDDINQNEPKSADTLPIINIISYDVTKMPKIKVWQGPNNLNNPLNFARFQLTNIFPDVAKLIYLDPDVVVQGDLTEMWDTHLITNEFALAAVPSTKRETYSKFIIDFETTKVNRNEPYFNAGVMMLNLKRWKETNKDAEIKKWLDLNLERPIYKFGSQPPLLLAFYQDYEKMEGVWNFRHLGHKMDLRKGDIERAKIVHFNGPRKPWGYNAIPQYQAIWTKYYHPDDSTMNLVVWGFESLQDSHYNSVHHTCYTRPSCKEDAARIGVTRSEVHIDAFPNPRKYLPVLQDFVEDMWQMDQIPYMEDGIYPWHFLWVRKQSDLQTRLRALNLQWDKLNPNKQVVNFIPGVHQESYFKDRFCMNTQSFVRRHKDNPAAIAGLLDCFVIPEQSSQLIETASLHKDKVWIGKLASESSGHGIEIYPGVESLKKKDITKTRVIQSYVDKPFLIDSNGGMRKIDLRLYVVVTSLDPLRIYIHPAGQVKVAQAVYNNNYTDEFAHISNKVGSAGRAYDTKDDELRKERQIDEFKFRLTLDDLANMMEPEIWRDAWEKTEDLMVRAVLAFSNKLGCKSLNYPYLCNSAFQLLGVDVVYDQDMQPHLMEINNDPGWNPYFEKRNSLMSTTGGTAEGAQCMFPFTHEGKSYIGECVEPSGDKADNWCYTDKEGHWGYCDETDESAHNLDTLQGVYNAVYGDLLHLTGAISYNTNYETAVRSRYDYLCENGLLPESCRGLDVKEAVIRTANEMENGGNFRLIFPQPTWRAKYLDLVRHYDDNVLNDPGVLPADSVEIWDIIANYFSFDLQ
eukprot:Ihof_evm1s847 gene=Ihof_evmTU1s847